MRLQTRTWRNQTACPLSLGLQACAKLPAMRENTHWEVIARFVLIDSEPEMEMLSSTAAAGRTPGRKQQATYKTQKGANIMTGQTRTSSIEPEHRFSLPERRWEDLNEPGAYVDLESGDLYRVPQEALIAGGSCIVCKESSGSSRLAQISTNPFVTTEKARLRCAQFNIEPNF